MTQFARRVDGMRCIACNHVTVSAWVCARCSGAMRSSPDVAGATPTQVAKWLNGSADRQTVMDETWNRSPIGGTGNVKTGQWFCEHCQSSGFHRLGCSPVSKFRNPKQRAHDQWWRDFTEQWACIALTYAASRWAA